MTLDEAHRPQSEEECYLIFNKAGGFEVDFKKLNKLRTDLEGNSRYAARAIAEILKSGVPKP